MRAVSIVSARAQEVLCSPRQEIGASYITTRDELFY